MGTAPALTILFILILIYLIPSWIAWETERRQALPITILNVFLGWTLLGWVISLVWATMKDKEVLTNG